MRRLTFALLLAACGGDAASSDDTEPGDGGTGGMPTADTGPAGGALPDAAPPDAAAPDAAPVPPTCATTYRYDPLADTELTTFPDDFYTVDDPSRPTGLRVTVADAPWRGTVVNALEHVFEDLETIDGFGVSAGVVLRFTAPIAEVPSGPSTASEGPIALWTLGDDPRRIAFEVQTADAGATLILNPMEPLPEATPAGVIVSSELTDADGGCVAPSPVLWSLLTGTPEEPRYARLVPRYRSLLEAAGVSAESVAAAVAFTPQSATALSAEVAANVAASSPDWAEAPTCATRASFVDCQITAELDDYRVGDAILDAQPKGKYTVTFNVWLPKERLAPVPLVVFGHGLGGSRAQARDIAGSLCPEGFAVMGVDALGHGDHPTAPEDTSPFALIEFLGLDVATQSVYARRIRDNFRQSAFDKLQILRILDAHADVNGDGAPDLDLDRVAYWGLSLGGIMGPEPLALDPHYSAGILTVAGARLIDIVVGAPAFAQFAPFLKNFAGGEDNLARAVPVIQTVVDAGDPVAYAPHVLRNRLAPGGERVPHVLQTMAIGDEIVFNPANRMLARALGLPHVPPVFQEVGVIAESGPAPLKANVEGTTEGLFQYDRVRSSRGTRPVAASHDTAFYMEPATQMFRFLQTWRDDGAPTLIDPYEELQTPPLN